MHRFTRVLLSFVFGLGCLNSPMLAQTRSDKPIKLMVPFTPGGGTDILARMLAPKLTEKLGVSVLVENMPGAAGAIAAQHTARAEPDGSTLMVGSTSEIGINPSLYPKLPYNVARDFAPVTPLASTPMVLVVHPLPSATPLARSGKLRVVAVSTKERVSVMPEVPTFIESGVSGYVMEYWYGLIAPAAVSADYRKRIHAVTSDIMKQPDMVANLSKQGLQPTYRSPEEFAAFIKSDMERWAAVVKSANITLDP